jgi:MFS family permease
MLVAAAVARAIGLRGMFVGSAVLYGACLVSWTVLDVPIAIIATRAFSGIGFAGVIVAVVLTIAALLPADLQATGQSLFQTSAFGVAAIVANVIGGILYDSLGHVAVFGLGAVMALAAAVLGWFVVPGRRQPAGRDPAGPEPPGGEPPPVPGRSSAQPDGGIFG